MSEPIREALEREIRAAFEAGHHTWPTSDDPTRAALCAAYVAERLAALGGAAPTPPQECTVCGNEVTLADGTFNCECPSPRCLALSPGGGVCHLASGHDGAHVLDYPPRETSAPTPAPQTWQPTNETIAAMLLSYLYRIYDGGGISCGRSWESRLVEPALRLLDAHRPKIDITDWPDREAVIRQAEDRLRALIAPPTEASTPAPVTQTCATCRHWDRRLGSCAKLVTGPGFSVQPHTPPDFGCILHSPSEASTPYSPQQEGRCD